MDKYARLRSALLCYHLQVSEGLYYYMYYYLYYHLQVSEDLCYYLCYYLYYNLYYHLQVSEDLVPVNIACVADDPQLVFHITAYNSQVDKILDVRLVQPGKIIIITF